MWILKAPDVRVGRTYHAVIRLIDFVTSYRELANFLSSNSR